MFITAQSVAASMGYLSSGPKPPAQATENTTVQANGPAAGAQYAVRIPDRVGAQDSAADARFPTDTAAQIRRPPENAGEAGPPGGSGALPAAGVSVAAPDGVARSANSEALVASLIDADSPAPPPPTKLTQVLYQDIQALLADPAEG